MQRGHCTCGGGGSAVAAAHQQACKLAQGAGGGGHAVVWPGMVLEVVQVALLPIADECQAAVRDVVPHLSLGFQPHRDVPCTPTSPVRHQDTTVA